MPEVDHFRLAASRCCRGPDAPTLELVGEVIRCRQQSLQTLYLHPYQRLAHPTECPRERVIRLAAISAALNHGYHSDLIC